MIDFYLLVANFFKLVLDDERLRFVTSIHAGAGRPPIHVNCKCVLPEDIEQWNEKTN